MSITYNNVPLAYIDPVFMGLLDSLKDHGRRIYTATLAGDDTAGGCTSDAADQRKWQMPPPGSWDSDLFNITGISLAFDRTMPNNVYIRALTKGKQVGELDIAPEGEGRVSDCMAMKIQIDHVAVQERAFRLRHSSSVRCAMHAAARRRGHSNWNDAVGSAATLSDLGDGVAPAADDIAGPVGGIFTTMIRHLLLIIRGGYNEGPTDIVRPDTMVATLEDGTVIAELAS